MEQKEKKPGKRSLMRGVRTATVAEMVFSLLSIPCTLGYITTESAGAPEDSEVLRAILFVVFFMLALARLLRARRMRLIGKQKSKYIMQRVSALAFLACSILPLLVGYTRVPGLLLYAAKSPGDMSLYAFDYVGDVRQIIGLIFWTVLIIGRIVSIVRDHRWRRVIVNILLIVLIALWCTAAFLVCDLIIAMGFSIILTIGDIFTVVFARIHLDALKKIVRKTYAAEIVMGLLLLIVSFSYVLEFCEPDIHTFADGLWYCFAIVTTIGFGDIAAVTAAGRILSVILGIYGIVVVALITSIIVNFYGEVRREPDGPEETDEGEEAWNTSSKS